MKIGLYFGTFNPIHIGHLIIANHMAEHSDLDQIWMVVTPHNPHKQKNTLLDDYHRLHMVHLATEDYPKIQPSDIEFKLPQPNYTVNTLAHLQEKEIPCAIYYPIPLHKQKAYLDSRYKEEDFKVTNQLCDEVIALPMHTELDDEQIKFITDAVLEFV